MPVEEKGQIRSPRDLITWQKAVGLVKIIYQLSNRFPKDELYGLTSQMRRAAVSVPANIAESQGRRLSGEVQHFLGTARDSLLELDTHLEIAFQLSYINLEQHRQTQAKLDEVGRLLNGMLRSLNCSLTTDAQDTTPATDI